MVGKAVGGCMKIWIAQGKRKKSMLNWNFCTRYTAAYSRVQNGAMRKMLCGR
jgi:predicted nucleic acid-binding Zn finger protein